MYRLLSNGLAESVLPNVGAYLVPRSEEHFIYACESRLQLAKVTEGSCRLTFGNHAQFGFSQAKFREAAIQADQECRKCPDGRFAQTAVSGEMNIDFAVQRALLF